MKDELLIKIAKSVSNRFVGRPENLIRVSRRPGKSVVDAFSDGGQCIVETVEIFWAHENNFFSVRIDDEDGPGTRPIYEHTKQRIRAECLESTEYKIL